MKLEVGATVAISTEHLRSSGERPAASDGWTIAVLSLRGASKPGTSGRSNGPNEGLSESQAVSSVISVATVAPTAKDACGRWSYDVEVTIDGCSGSTRITGGTGEAVGTSGGTTAAQATVPKNVHPVVPSIDLSCGAQRTRRCATEGDSGVATGAITIDRCSSAATTIGLLQATVRASKAGVCLITSTVAPAIQTPMGTPGTRRIFTDELELPVTIVDRAYGSGAKILSSAMPTTEPAGEGMVGPAVTASGPHVGKGATRVTISTGRCSVRGRATAAAN